ncbi:MAG: hypothetical protein E3J72_11845 [Planctomycetota bacterium]|nr:MAG: hypothetical protein E3J72_11845 [Planctomycetota bacterium]
MRLSRFATILCAAGIVAFCYTLISRFAYLGKVHITVAWIIAFGCFLAMVISVFCKATLFGAALVADRECSLAERVSTAYELSGREGGIGGEFAVAVINDANAASSRINPQTVVPMRFPRSAAFLAVVMVLTATLAFMPTTYAREQAREDELSASVKRIRIDLSQAAGEIERTGRGNRNTALAEEIRKTKDKLNTADAGSYIRQLSLTLAVKRRKLEEQKAVVGHFKRSRLLSDFAQDLKEGIPAQAEAAARRAGQRLRMNPRPALREDAAQVIRRLLKEMKGNSELRRSLAEAEAALEAGNVGAFEDALARIARQFKSDIDEKALNLAEAVTASARKKLGLQDKPGILVGGEGGEGLPQPMGVETPREYGAALTGSFEPAVPVETANLPERFRPVVRKYFARGMKSNTITRN